MIAKELVTNLIPPLKTTDTGDKGLVWMHEFNVNQLPIIKGEKYWGLLNENDILDFNDPSEIIAKFDVAPFKPYVQAKAHIYEVIKLAAELHLAVVPVIDEKENYLGLITKDDIIKYFATLNSINENGSVIVLELNKNDYSLSEIARLVESNNTSILSSYISKHKDSMKLEVTLKLSAVDVKQISATFERFDYTVVGTYQESEYFEDLKDRYDSLMSYLNI